MALEKAVVVVNAPASAGQVLATLSFIPKWIEILSIESATDDAFVANASSTLGWAVSTGVGNQFAVGVRADDAVTTNQSKPRFQNDACVLMVDDTNPATVILEANLFETFATTNGGFKLDFPTTISGVKITILAIGGSDIANVSTLSFLQGAATGNVSFTGAGFTPNYLQFLLDGKATAFPGTGGKGPGFGVAVSTTKRWAASCLLKAQVAKAGKAGGHLLDTRCIVASKGPASVESESDFVSFDTDGGTVNVITAKSNFLVAVLCVEFSVDGDVDVGVETEPATASIKATTTTFDPEVLHLVSLNDPATAGVTDAKFSIGASDGTNRRSVYCGNLDNPPTDTKADSRQASAKVLIQCTPGVTPTLDGEAVETLGTLKFDMDWSSVSGNSNRFGWIVMKGAASGAPTHTSSGALASQNATLAGTAEIERTSSGTLPSQNSTLAGTVELEHTSSGALNSQNASMTGAATVEAEKTSSGTLPAQNSSLAGTAEIERTSSGVLLAQNSSITGVAEIERISSGALISQNASMTGIAKSDHKSTGVLQSQNANISGTAEIEKTSSGALASQSATMTGEATVEGPITSTGALASQNAVLAGTAERELVSTGALNSQDAILTGVAERELTSAGALQSDDATLVGTAERIITSVGALISSNASIAGTAIRQIVSSGALIASSAVLAGTAEIERTSTVGTGAAMQSQNATMTGTATVSGAGDITSTGALQAQNSILAGFAFPGVNATGALQSKPAALFGSSFLASVISIPETPTTIRAFNNDIDLDLDNVPQIEDEVVYKAVLDVHEAIEILADKIIEVEESI